MKHLVTLARAVLRALVLPGPFHLIFFVTARCNARCSMCFYLEEIESATENLPHELKSEEIEILFARLGFVPYVSFSGGEPFLRRDMGRIMDAAARHCRPLAVSLPTNGSMPERVVESFDKVCGDNPDVPFEAHVSIDGVGKVHDDIRKIPGLFDKVTQTLQGLAALKAKHRNLSVKIVATYSAFNRDAIEELVDYADQHLPFDRLIVAMAHGNCSTDSKSGLDRDHYRGLLRRVEALNTARSQQQGLAMRLARLVKRAKENLRSKWEREQSLGRYCNAGSKILVISEQGDVRPCEPLMHSMGNVRQGDYDVAAVARQGMAAFQASHPAKKCHCDWGCGQNVAVVSHPRFWARFLKS